MNKQTLGIAVAVLVIVAAAAYFTFTRMHTGSMEHMENTQMNVSGGHPTVQAPDFSLKTLEGKEISLSQFRGKAVVLNFFATWCPPCRGEIPGFVEVYNRYRDKGLVILGISLDSDPQEALPKFIKEHGITYPVAIGTREVIGKYGGVQTIPTTFFIDKSGQITNVHIGYLDEKALEDAVKELL